jgi:hypothetical protein
MMPAFDGDDGVDAGAHRGEAWRWRGGWVVAEEVEAELFVGSNVQAELLVARAAEDALPDRTDRDPVPATSWQVPGKEEVEFSSTKDCGDGLNGEKVQRGTGTSSPCSTWPGPGVSSNLQLVLLVRGRTSGLRAAREGL